MKTNNIMHRINIHDQVFGIPTLVYEISSIHESREWMFGLGIADKPVYINIGNR